MSEEKYLRTLVADENGNLVLDLGPELCNKMGWREGDVLEWTENKETGEWQLTKSTIQS